MEQPLFLSGSEQILDAIKQLIGDGDDYGIAVAFWGTGSETLIPQEGQGRIICNLTHPGTNPNVIERINSYPNVQIRYLDNLHAKVVVSDNGTFVGSANFSEAALGISSSSAQWLEAGVLIDPGSREAKKAWKWFETLWTQAALIEDEALSQAKARWAEHKLQEGPYGVVNHAPTLMFDDGLEHAGKHCLGELKLFAQRLDQPFGRDVMTMASDPFQKLYDTLMGVPAQAKPTGASRKAAGQAANLLWAQSGGDPKARLTTDEGTILVSDPKIFLKRSQDTRNYERVSQFLIKLAEEGRDNVDEAYRFWAGVVIKQHKIK
ncbi:phospholipase D family protein [Ectopseudomonas oleovorans]|uniref:Phospholipase D family protein n=1 Tax=Ectopseudomonas oleovorans TaxID=301 RepID=A0A379K648_ECTOL|nr:phospholipase D family protein [Pseudomonas oleovorans]MDH1341362.1 phospholipase D family protein [Pseudomonas oleovorans]MDH1494918.1 phospholipase D family protein [Pseudomonas oleovorans]WGG23161.1 phospholipase D family protein [Pseudomonas oleovorans]SUD60186.1 Predicted HKD family nuclease [Pseudomonas oleovorans]